MKILYISSPAFCDTDIPLIKSLIEAGNEVMYLITVGDRVRSTLISLDEHHNDVGIYKCTEYSELDFISTYIGTDNVFTIRRKQRKSFSECAYVSSLLQQIVDDYKPDVVHQIDLPYLFMLPFLIRNRKRYILTVHDPIPHKGENSWKLNLSRMLVYPFVKKIILLNSKSRDLFISKYHQSAKKIFVSRLGFLEWMNAFATSRKSDDYILFYGRITPYKGVEYLLQAMESVHASFPNIKLIIAGSGNYYFDISKYRSLDYIKFINRFIELTELSDLIINSRFVVCPYIEATQSGVVASVLALETPIIVTEVGALSDMVENNVTGLIIPPSNEIALIDSICRLLSNEQLTKSMRVAIGARKTEGEYSWHTIAGLTEEIYKA